MSTQIKFKVGDRVRVRHDIKVGMTYDMDNGQLLDKVMPDMAALKGQVVTIVDNRCKYLIEGCIYRWTDKMFEEGVINMPKLNQNLPKDVAQVFIDEKNNAVTVELSNGNKATAKCSQGDTFDAYVGFCIAYNKVKFGGKNGGIYDIKKMFKSCIESANKKGYKVAILKNRQY